MSSLKPSVVYEGGFYTGQRIYLPFGFGDFAGGGGYSPGFYLCEVVGQMLYEQRVISVIRMKARYDGAGLFSFAEGDKHTDAPDLARLFARNLLSPLDMFVSGVASSHDMVLTYKDGGRDWYAQEDLEGLFDCGDIDDGGGGVGGGDGDVGGGVEEGGGGDVSVSALLLRFCFCDSVVVEQFIFGSVFYGSVALYLRFCFSGSVALCLWLIFSVLFVVIMRFSLVVQFCSSVLWLGCGSFADHGWVAVLEQCLQLRLSLLCDVSNRAK